MKVIVEFLKKENDEGKLINKEEISEKYYEKAFSIVEILPIKQENKH